MMQQGYRQGEQLLNTDLIKPGWQQDNAAYQGYGLTWWLNRPVAGSYDPALTSRAVLLGSADASPVSENLESLATFNTT